MNSAPLCQHPDSTECRWKTQCSPGRCAWGELRKEIWDKGQHPFLEYVAQLLPHSALRLIDGVTLEPIGGLVPNDWDGTLYLVLDMYEAHRMQMNHPDEFAAYVRGNPENQ